MKKLIVFSLFITFVALIGIVFLLRNNGTNSSIPLGQSNVSIINGKQIIQIDAKGGYMPRTTMAKANIPTTINVRTRGTFDCSSAISIPSLGFRANLPPSGMTPIEIPSQSPGTTIKGVCAMGMYTFAVNFN